MFWLLSFQFLGRKEMNVFQFSILILAFTKIWKAELLRLSVADRSLGATAPCGLDCDKNRNEDVVGWCRNGFL